MMLKHSAALLLSALALHANAAATLEIPAATKPPVIDGVNAPGEWDEAVELTGLQMTNDSGLAKEQTKLRFKWDADFIYVIADCYDSNTKILNQGAVYNDCIELFFVAPGSSDITHWMLNSRGGAVLNFVDAEYGGDYRQQRGEIASAVKIHPDRWVMEARIPAASLYLDGFTPRYPLKFNAHRTFNDNLTHKSDGRGPEYSSFSYVRGQYQKPLDFANAFLKGANHTPVQVLQVGNGTFQLKTDADADVRVRFRNGENRKIAVKNGIAEFKYPADSTGFEVIVLRDGETCFANTWHFFPKDLRKLEAMRSEQRKLTGLGVGVADSMTRIFAANPYTAKADSVTLSAAGREQENFQIVLFTGADAVNDIRLTASELKGPNGAKLDADAIRLYRQGTAIADGVGYPTVNGAGLYPDPLYPLTGALTLKPESVQGLWASVAVPPETKPGEYTGTITVSAAKIAPQTVTVKLTVRNFTLPLKQSLRNSFSIWESPLYRLFAAKQNLTPEEFLKLVDAHAMILLEHRLTPIILGTPRLLPDSVTAKIAPRYVKQPDGSYKVEAEAFDALNRKYLSLGATCFNIGPHLWPAVKHGNKIPAEWPGIWKAVNDHYKANGMIKDAFAYPFDEPGNGNPDFVNAIMKVIRDNAPDVKTLITGSNASFPSLRFRDIDIWVPASHWVNYRTKPEAQAAGQEVWWYPCSGPWFPYPNYHLDLEPGAWRILPFATYKYNFDGILYWATAFYNLENPLKNNSYSSNGEGVLVYTEPNGMPVPSVRLKVIADSMEDYEYLTLLKNSAARAAKNPAKAAAVREAEDLLKLKSMVRYHDDYALAYADYDRFRNQAAKLIETLNAD